LSPGNRDRSLANFALGQQRAEVILEKWLVARSSPTASQLLLAILLRKFAESKAWLRSPRP